MVLQRANMIFNLSQFLEIDTTIYLQIQSHKHVQSHHNASIRRQHVTTYDITVKNCTGFPSLLVCLRCWSYMSCVKYFGFSFFFFCKPHLMLRNSLIVSMQYESKEGHPHMYIWSTPSGEFCLVFPFPHFVCSWSNRAKIDISKSE